MSKSILKRLVDSKILPIHQLVLLTAIRKMLSQPVDEPPVSEILNQTNLLSILAQVFKFSDALNEEVRAMKLEALWIVTNLAYGTIEDIKVILSH
jgi:hypothetical protein